MEELILKHFKAFEDSISLQNLNGKNVLLFGENGAGKSSLYDAMRYIFYKDRIEAVDDMLPAVDKTAKIAEIRAKYKNNKSTLPFEIQFNGHSFEDVAIDKYQVFMLNRFDKVDSIKILEVLEHSYLPIDAERFVKLNCDDIIANVNDELSGTFYEPIEISLADKMNGFVVTIRNKESELIRSNELSVHFNEAIINLIQLLIWFSAVQLLPDKTKKCIIVLDDFITSLDASNRSFLIRYVLRTFKGAQLLVFTHDYSFFNMASYIIKYIEQENSDWIRFKLYSTDHGHCLTQVKSLKAQDLQNEYNTPGCDYDTLGNKVRKCFEQQLHDLAIMLSIGNLEETKCIVDRISRNEMVYWKSGSTIQDLVFQIEHLVPKITDTDVRNAFKELIGQYKLKKASKLKDTIISLKLYQKIAMHPLSHSTLGIPHFAKKDVRQALNLLDKLEHCIHGIQDGKI